MAGAVYKFPMGPKAVISGGLVGGLHSSIVKMLLKLLKTTVNRCFGNHSWGFIRWNYETDWYDN